MSALSAGEKARAEAIAKRNWLFLKGVVSPDGVPAADRPEVAFAGRSNVGKSSLINALLAQNGLARTSNTPGRTQEINFFTAGEEAMRAYVVDLPGYGYAKAPKKTVAQWTNLIMSYLRGRPNLKRVFLLIDARHGIKATDAQVMELLDDAAVSYLAVLTKLDKLNRDDQQRVADKTRASLDKRVAAYPDLMQTSTLKGWGLDEARFELANALEISPALLNLIQHLLPREALNQVQGCGCFRGHPHA
ncbi:MAG: ribosome biogenesis GTP-binding protein YihA/YsxC [Pseudomonadota bacterium]